MIASEQKSPATAKLGQIVYWHRTPDDEALAAIVAAVFPGGIVNLTVFCHNGAPVAKEEVRHLSDPRRHLSVEAGYGCWSHSAET